MTKAPHSDSFIEWLLGDDVFSHPVVNNTAQAHIVSLKDIANDYPELEKGKPLTKSEREKMRKIKIEVEHMKRQKNV
jgi:hypothetical protein